MHNYITNKCPSAMSIQSLIRSEIIECYQMDVEKMMLYALGVVWTFEQQTQH